MKLGERLFKCGACGFTMDRDLNAALNLVQIATSRAETVNAHEKREVHDWGQVSTQEAGTETGQLRSILT